MEKKVMKAEILITRRCNLRCPYCNMVRRNTQEIDSQEWFKIFDTLVGMGCGFFALYGAEPLLYPGIYDVIKYLSQHSMAYSLLTNSIALTDDVKRTLTLSNVQSITLSMDSMPPDVDGSVGRRNNSSLDAILWALDCKIPDIQITSTVHKQNIGSPILDVIEFANSNGLWYSFDFIHDNKSQMGYDATESKVSEKSLQYSFTDQDLESIVSFLGTLLDLKDKGYKIYQSSSWLRYLLNNPLEVIYRNWRCSTNPSWLSIDSDGTVLLCDDFLRSSHIMAYDLPSRWNDFLSFREAVSNCRGCIWSTHWMSYEQLLMKDGESIVTHYRSQI